MAVKERLAASRSQRVAGVYDRAVYAKQLVTSFRTNRQFRHSNPDFATPPLSTLRDATASTQLDSYRDSGMASAHGFWNLFRAHALTQPIERDEPFRVLEWGCGPARIIRHLPALAAADGIPVEFFGTDINPRSISWAQENIPTVSFSMNGPVPPLDFPDDHFDFAYCWSVFTHLSESVHPAWISELTRLVRPGAPFVLSTQGSELQSRLSESERQRFENGEMVEIPRAAEGKLMYSAFHPPQYMSGLLAGLDIVEHDAPASGQETWVVRRPMTGT